MEEQVINTEAKRTPKDVYDRATATIKQHIYPRKTIGGIISLIVLIAGCILAIYVMSHVINAHVESLLGKDGFDAKTIEEEAIAAEREMEFNAYLSSIKNDVDTVRKENEAKRSEILKEHEAGKSLVEGKMAVIEAQQADIIAQHEAGKAKVAEVTASIEAEAAANSTEFDAIKAATNQAKAEIQAKAAEQESLLAVEKEKALAQQEKILNDIASVKASQETATVEK